MSLLFKEWLSANENLRMTYKDIRTLRVCGAIQLLVFHAHVPDALHETNVEVGKEYSLVDLAVRHLHNIYVFTRTSFDTPMHGALADRARVITDFSFEILDPVDGGWRRPAIDEEIADDTVIGWGGGPAFHLESIDLNDKVRVEHDPECDWKYI
jgi:hypothetical protein